MQEKCTSASQCRDKLLLEARCPPKPVTWINFFLQLATNATLVQKYHTVIHQHPAMYRIGKIASQQQHLHSN
jgi:hypothetical protein